MNEIITAKKSPVLLVGAAVMIGCVLRCWNINQSFWWDEIWSTMTFVNAGSLWQVVSNLGYYFNNHVLYSLLARSSIIVLGESEVAARFPALVMGLLGISVLFQFGKRFLGTPAGMIASLLLALSAFHIDHSSEARGYSGLALFSVLSSFYFLKGLKSNDYKPWVPFVLSTVLGFYSHVFMCVVSLSQFVSAVFFAAGEKWFFWKTEISVKAFRNFFFALTCAAFITLVIYSPILLPFFTNVGKVRLVEVSRLPFLLNLLNTFFPGIKSLPGFIVYLPIFLHWCVSYHQKRFSAFGLPNGTHAAPPFFVYCNKSHVCL